MKLKVKLKSQTKAHSHARALHHADSMGFYLGDICGCFGVSMPFLKSPDLFIFYQWLSINTMCIH